MQAIPLDPAQARDILETVNAITMYDPERGGIDNSLFFTKLKRFFVPAIASAARGTGRKRAPL